MSFTEHQKRARFHAGGVVVSAVAIAGSFAAASCLDIVTRNEVFFSSCPPGGKPCYGGCTPSFQDIVPGSTWESVMSTGTVLCVCYEGTSGVISNPPPPCYCSFSSSNPVTYYGAQITGVVACPIGP